MPRTYQRKTKTAPYIKWSPEMKQAVADYWRSGMPLKEMAVVLGISEMRIRNKVHYLGLQPRWNFRDRPRQYKQSGLRVVARWWT